MTIWLQAFIAGSAAAILIGLIWVGVTLQRINREAEAAKHAKKKPGSFSEAAVEEVNHLFNNEFREELRNHGRLYFEKIISENAMFLKQDLDMTITQLNQYLQKEITGKLDDEFAAYAKAMNDAQQLTLDSLKKNAAVTEEQLKTLTETLQTDVAAREAALVKTFEDNMADIVEHYILQALGDQFDLKSQLPYIISQMEANKQKIAEDMRL